MTLRWRAVVDRLRSSLFWTPAAMLAAGVLLALAVAAIEHGLGDRLTRAPDALRIAPAAGTRMLEIVALSTITVAGLVSSVMVVAVQLSSSQFSPRVLRRFLRDRISQLAIGTIAGTFTFSLVSLVRRDPGSTDPAADLAVTLGVVLAGASLLAIIGFIDHTARMMQAGRMIRDVTEETQALIVEVMHESAPPLGLTAEGIPDGPGAVVRSTVDGWIQEIDADAILAAVPPGTAVRLDLPVGKFAIDGAPLCTLWPEPDDLDGLAHRLRGAYSFGEQRAMRQDVAFGIRQLVDIALRALSPGINDPGTAYEVITNLGAVLAALIVRDTAPHFVVGEDDRRLYNPNGDDHTDYVQLAFEQLRLAAAPHPAVAVAMIHTLVRVAEIALHHGRPERTTILRTEAARIVEQVVAVGHIRYDRRRVADSAAPLGVGLEGGQVVLEDDWRAEMLRGR